ncbi:MAG: DUF2163 domain-containing protein [Acidobacteriota bacterium]|nr:DUF2163 domain-containing protein [Acidobacteriota bacterium]
MKSNDPDLIAHLLQGGTNKDGHFIFAELYTIELLSGDVLRFTSADGDVTHGGNTWLAGPLEISRGTTRSAVGFEVDDLPLDIVSDGETVILNGYSLQKLMQLGFMEHAQVTIEKLYFETWGATPPWDPFVVFYGRWASAEIGWLRCKAEIKFGEELHQPWPRRHVGASCAFVVFDADCTLDREDFRTDVTAEAGSTTIKLYSAADLSSQPAGWFPLGYVRALTGLNAGLSMSIKAQGPGYVVLDAPLLVAPGVGDTFAVYPGCANTMDACDSKFDNLANYGGQPNVPVPETAI